MELVEYGGIRMTREAAEIAERERIDVWLLKRDLALSPWRRLQENEGAAELILKLRDAGKMMRSES